LVLRNLTLFAQTVKSPWMIHGTEKSAIHVPPQEIPAGLTRIYSNGLTFWDTCMIGKFTRENVELWLFKLTSPTLDPAQWISMRFGAT
jgi:hypothetical protein